jgi:hypothetical protein
MFSNILVPAIILSLRLIVLQVLAMVLDALGLLQEEQRSKRLLLLLPIPDLLPMG